jgi:hypothetical protein
VCVAEACVFFLNFFCCLSIKKQIADEAATQPASQRPLRARSGSVAWAPLPPVVSWGRLDRVHLCCTRRPLLHCPALPAGSTCSTPLARCFAGLSLPPLPAGSNDGLYSARPLLRRLSPATRPAGRVHRWFLPRSPATSSSPDPRAPRPAHVHPPHLWYTGRPLLHRPDPRPNARPGRAGPAISHFEDKYEVYIRWKLFQFFHFLHRIYGKWLFSLFAIYCG